MGLLAQVSRAGSTAFPQAKMCRTDETSAKDVCSLCRLGTGQRNVLNEGDCNNLMSSASWGSMWVKYV